MFDQRHVEVDQVAKTSAGQLEISEELRLVEWLHLLDSFQLTDDSTRDQYIQAYSFGQRGAIITDGKGNLMLEGDPALLELVAEASFIDTLQKSWAQITMNGIGCVHNNPADPVILWVYRRNRDVRRSV
jgi:hypothetical protein